jgi:hypothetical protein
MAAAQRHGVPERLFSAERRISPATPIEVVEPSVSHFDAG